MSYLVRKVIHFSYAHRLLRHQGKCNCLHGHNAKVEISLASDKLDAIGMVMDFTEIERIIGKWIDQTLDYKILLAEEDSLVPVLREAGQPLVLFEENPTAENIAKKIHDFARSQGLPIKSVEVWETPTSCARYGQNTD